MPVESFDDDVLCVDTNRLPESLKNILWINDDFLCDEDVIFDDKAFEIIDSGADYLNPKHFSARGFLLQYVNTNRD